MKALVIGGAGFIGSHTVDALIEKGFEVKAAVAGSLVATIYVGKECFEKDKVLDQV